MLRNEAVSKSNRGKSRVVTGGARATPKSVAGTTTMGANRRMVKQVADETTQGDREVARAALLVQKQADLDATINKHDDMIREMFQMENFRNMVLYDPKVAKQDSTAVFKEYKAKYDLVENAASIAGPSRRTRGQANERRQILKSNAIPLPSTASPSFKKTPKPKEADRPELEKILSNVSQSYKGKGKEKEGFLHPLTDNVEFAQVEQSASVIFVRRKQTSSTPRFISKNVDPQLRSQSPESISTYKIASHKAIVRTHVSSLKRPATVPIDVLEQTERHLVNASSELDLPLSTICPSSITTLPEEPVLITRRSGRLRELPHSTLTSSAKPKIHPPISDKKQPSPPPAHGLTASPDLSKIKRVKLIVRRPPLKLTDPRQRPPPPKFNSSLPQFFSSYISIDDAQPYADPDKLAEQAMAEATILERVEQFRVAGRFIPGTEVLFGTTAPDTPYIPPRRTTRDMWDDVIEAVVAHAKTRPKKPLGRTVAAQVATRVQTHFATKEMRRTKARDMEERRLRNLAKSTMKAVVAEWKKAVYHIREKRRLELEEEERQVGRAHLASILDQSGQILETQQEDLSRGDMYGSRSRSGSVGDFNDDHGDADEEEDTADEDEEDENGNQDEYESQRTLHSLLSGDEDQESDGEDDNEGTSLLLAGNASNLSHPPSTTRSAMSTPASMPSELETEDDAEVSTTQMLNRTSNALSDLMMYADSDSETDLEDPLQGGPANGTVEPMPSSPDGREDVRVGTGIAGRLDVGVNIENPHPRSRSREVRFAEDSLSKISDDVEPDQEHNPVDGDVVGNDSFDMPMQVDDNNENTEQIGQDIEEEEQEHTGEPEDITGDMGENNLESRIPDYLKPYAVAPVEWDPDAKITPPLLLRGVLRPYQQSGLEWLASLHVNKLNGILADEMGLGKTIQTISLLAHLACDRGIWGPHLIIVPTSVLLNWEMEFKKFLPGFNVLSYHGSTKRRKDLRQGWNDKHLFNVCITSYTLASRDAHIFKRKAWYYMILDEAHMIKNFKSQRWNILLMFRSYRRLLLTGTPLQNNLTELWALLQFLMSGANFANLKEFGEWFSNPLEKAIELGNAHDEDTMQTVNKLHTVLRPYLLRRLKRDVEKELPSKFEHLTMCPLSKRQRFLYDEFMERAQTRDALQSGVYQKIANILMQLRKVCNHPDLFEVRPIITSFAMTRSAVADYEIKELLVRRQLLSDEDSVNLHVVGLNFIDRQSVSLLSAVSTRYLDATSKLPHFTETAGEPAPKDTRTIAGFRKYTSYMKQKNRLTHWSHIGYLNKLRCSKIPILSEEMLSVVGRMTTRIVPFSDVDLRHNYMERVDRVHQAVKSYATRAQEMAPSIHHFAFVTPAVVALDLPRIALAGHEDIIRHQPLDLDAILHPISVKLQIAFPDPSLLQWDCGKLQRLADLLREKKAGGHRVLIFTQMTRILDVLEIFLNFHGYLYLRLDGATKIEDRQYITERFNADPRVFCFIASSRSGGVGINLTGADTVVFYDSDFNPQMDKQCEDRAHRIGQIRDVHIYRFVSQHTVEEAMLLKAEQKRSLDELVIQRGAFDWRALLGDASGEGGSVALARALGEYEDVEDRHAAAVAAREEFSLVGQDAADFADGEAPVSTGMNAEGVDGVDVDDEEAEEEDEQGGSVVEYMLAVIEADYEYFRDWRL